MRVLNYILGGCLALCLTLQLARSQSNLPAGSSGTLVFDSESKKYDAKPGEPTASFTILLTNTATSELVINDVHPSCGCTTAKLPPTPWHIPPGGNGKVEARINLSGKNGAITKTLTFKTSAGIRVVSLHVNIPPPAAGTVAMTDAQRKQAMAMAAGDPAAIFKGDCAACHVAKGVNKYGEALYAADCGICHESSHRASAVPDLHALKISTDYDYWKTTITLGKPHTMMPGFATAQGGPLTDRQIASLATYLTRTISHRLGVMTNASAAQ